MKQKVVTQNVFAYFFAITIIRRAITKGKQSRREAKKIKGDSFGRSNREKKSNIAIVI